MTITSSPEDKFAFLFTGPTDVDRFIKDIENVVQVLTEYYNYPAGNITVVLGSNDATPNVPSGVGISTIEGKDDFENALESFLGYSGPDHTVLLYFTGGGDNTNGPKLLIDGSMPNDTGSNVVDPTWLIDRLSTFSDGYLNVVMQQSYSGGFLSEFQNSSLSKWSFTFACSDSEQSWGTPEEGSFFTYYWLKGLKFEQLPQGTDDPGKFADELGSGDEATNLQISLEEAADFGKQYQFHDLEEYSVNSTPGYADDQGPHYLGEPEFLIRDGDPWYESPDIYLTHPNHNVPPGDLYIPDDPDSPPPPLWNNTINVEVRNVGTHPVRAYSLGTELFRTGACGDSVQYTLELDLSDEILFPIDLIDIGTGSDAKDKREWNTPFYETCTHRCVKAEAKLLHDDVDFEWSVVANNFEGQRNIDEMKIKPLPERTPVANLQGYKEHVYTIRNPFDVPRTFYFVFPEKYPEYKKYINLWCAEITGPQRKRIPLKVVEKPVPHIPFKLKPGQGKEFLLHAEMNPKSKFPREGIRLSFDILVEGKWDKARTSKHAVLLPGCAPISGITVVITERGVTLEGKVLDSRRKPVPGASISLRTLNGLQEAHTRADKKGRYTFQDINRDIYKIQAGIGSRRSKGQMIVLLNEKEEFDINLKFRAWEGARRTKEH